MIEESAAPVEPIDEPPTVVGQIAELIEQGEDPAPVQPVVADDPPAIEGEDPAAVADDDKPPIQGIDYELMVPIGAGYEDASLGTIKDFYKENQDWKQEQSTWEQTRTEQENQQIVARQELVELVGLLGEVSPAALQKLDSIKQVNLGRQKELLAQVRPEWDDPAVKAKASEAMLATVKEVGFSDAEYNAISDYRVLKLLDDYTKLKAQAAQGREALEKAAELQKLNKPAQLKQSKAQKDRIAHNKAMQGTESEKLTRIAGLIQGG